MILVRERKFKFFCSCDLVSLREKNLLISDFAIRLHGRRTSWSSRTRRMSARRLKRNRNNPLIEEQKEHNREKLRIHC